MRDLVARSTDRVLQHQGPLANRLVSGDDDATLAAGDDLVELEAEAAGVAQAAEPAAAVGPAVGLRHVLDQAKPSRLRQGLQLVHPRRRAAHVHRQDRLGAGGDLALDVGGIEVERLVDLGQDRHRAQMRHARHRGDEGVGRHDDLVPGTETDPGAGAHQRSRAGADRHRVGSAHVGGERLLELGHLRRPGLRSVVAEEALAAYHLQHGRLLLRADEVAAGIHRWVRSGARGLAAIDGEAFRLDGD